MRRRGIRLESFWFAHLGSLIGSLYRPFFVPPTRRCRRGRKSSAVHTLLSSLAFMSPNVTTAPIRCHQFNHLHCGGGPHHRSVRMLTVESTRQRCPASHDYEESTGELVNVSTAAVKSGVLSERDVWASKCIK